MCIRDSPLLGGGERDELRVRGGSDRQSVQRDEEDERDGPHRDRRTHGKEQARVDTKYLDD